MRVKAREECRALPLSYNPEGLGGVEPPATSLKAKYLSQSPLIETNKWEKGGYGL